MFIIVKQALYIPKNEFRNCFFNERIL